MLTGKEKKYLDRQFKGFLRSVCECFSLTEGEALKEIVIRAAETDEKKMRKNTNRTIENLPLSELQKRCVLEWLAWKMWELLIELGIEDGYSKPYDPLLIEDDECHSYIFELGDGGRHHSYRTLGEIEEKLMKEVVVVVKEAAERIWQ